MTPPGWYQDPTRPTGELLRWWDGTVWTNHTCPNPATVQQPQAAATGQAPPAPTGASTNPSTSPSTPPKASGWLSGVVGEVAKVAKGLAAGAGEPGPEEFANRYSSAADVTTAPAKARSTWIPPFALLAVVGSVFLAAFGKNAAMGIALAAVAVAIGLINRWRIVDTPAVPIAAVYPGVCEVVGTARPPSGVTLRALGTGTECCWWSAELKRHWHDSDGDHWDTVWRTGSGNVPFELWDAADDAAILVEGNAVALAVTTVTDAPSKDHTFVERLVPIGATAYAQGPVQFYEGRPIMTTRRPPDAPTTRTTDLILAPGTEAETRAASLRGVWALGAVLGVWVGIGVTQAMVSPQSLPMSLVVAEVVGLLIGGAVLSGVRLRNRLVEVKWRIAEADALISTFAQRRHDLIGQLAATRERNGRTRTPDRRGGDGSTKPRSAHRGRRAGPRPGRRASAGLSSAEGRRRVRQPVPRARAL